MFEDLITKGGINLADQKFGQLQVRPGQRTLGKKIFDPTERFLDKATADSGRGTEFDYMDYIAPNGYLPQKIISRGIAKIQLSSEILQGKPRKAMLKSDRKFAVIDKKIDRIAEEYYNSVIYPKQSLVESETVAIDQLRTALGLQSRKSLLQLPMSNEKSDRVYKTLKTQMEADDMLRPDGRNRRLMPRYRNEEE